MALPASIAYTALGGIRLIDPAGWIGPPSLVTGGPPAPGVWWWMILAPIFLGEPRLWVWWLGPAKLASASSGPWCVLDRLMVGCHPFGGAHAPLCHGGPWFGVLSSCICCAATSQWLESGVAWWHQSVRWGPSASAWWPRPCWWLVIRPRSSSACYSLILVLARVGWRGGPGRVRIRRVGCSVRTYVPAPSLDGRRGRIRGWPAPLCRRCVKGGLHPGSGAPTLIHLDCPW